MDRARGDLCEVRRDETMRGDRSAVWIGSRRGQTDGKGVGRGGERRLMGSFRATVEETGGGIGSSGAVGVWWIVGERSTGDLTT